MDLKISEIAERIRSEQLSEAERETNSIQLLAQRLNKLLIASGDLIECALGKVETKQGEQHGISGEYREPPEGKHYWQPLYSESGYEYVLGLFQRNRGSILNPPAQVPAPSPAPVPQNVHYRYSRTDRRRMQEKYDNAFRVILLEGPESYWIYDEDAVFLGKLFGFKACRTVQGYNLTYKKDIHTSIVKKLKRARIAFLVVHQEMEVQFVPPAEPTPQIGAISIGTKFSVRDEEGELFKFIILYPEDAYIPTPVDLGNGFYEIIPVLREDFDGYRIVTTGTPLAQAAIGKRIGQTFECNGVEYTVIEIVVS